MGARKAALAKGRRKRVVFIVGGLRVCGQRGAGAGRPMAAGELVDAGLTHWVSVCGPGRCAVMGCWWRSTGVVMPKALAELPLPQWEQPRNCRVLGSNIADTKATPHSSSNINNLQP